MEKKSMVKKRKKKSQKIVQLESLMRINLDAAGIDIGADELFVCVPEGREEKSVRTFGTFTNDLHQVSEWLRKCKVTTVAMESTGVLWIPLYEHLVDSGFEVYLINARHIKNVPGKKTDVVDCQWIQQLHTYGLLQNSFRPEEEMVALRSLVRQREMVIRYRSAHIQHIHKALQQMNLKLDRVVTDVTGKTGMTILRAILAGERDVKRLAAHRDGRCSHSEAEIAQALVGNYRKEHLFALQQAVEFYDFYSQQIQKCDHEIESRYTAFRPWIDSQKKPLPAPKRKKPHGNEPDFDLRTNLYRMAGVDLTAIEGVSALTAQTVLSEIGLDMSAWLTVKHFTSWLGLCPQNQISGGHVLKRGTAKVANRAAQALRMAAQSLHRSHSELGIYYRKMKSKHGPQVATTATAHKLARIIYAMLKNKTAYIQQDLDAYEEKRHQYHIKSLQKQAQKLGFELLPVSST
jgi:transposase